MIQSPSREPSSMPASWYCSIATGGFGQRLRRRRRQALRRSSVSLLYARSTPARTARVFDLLADEQTVRRITQGRRAGAGLAKTRRCRTGFVPLLPCRGSARSASPAMDRSVRWPSSSSPWVHSTFNEEVHLQVGTAAWSQVLSTAASGACRISHMNRVAMANRVAPGRSLHVPAVRNHQFSPRESAKIGLRSSGTPCRPRTRGSHRPSPVVDLAVTVTTKVFPADEPASSTPK